VLKDVLAGRPAALAAVAAALLAGAPGMRASDFSWSELLSKASPAAGATGVCPDTPLRLVFKSPPELGTAGRITIRDADGTVVEAIDIGARTGAKTIGGLSGFKYYPVIVEGNQATIYPLNGELRYHRTYTVTVDAGVFRFGPEASPALGQTGAWRFTTRGAPPAAGPARLTVAADGTGDFCTVQGALDFIPDGNTTPTTVFIRSGTYTELVFFTNKHAVTLLGEDRKKTVIAYANNERFNAAGGNPYGAGANPVLAARHIYRRAVLLAHRVNGLTIENLTIRNTTPHGGSQAEAIILNGTPEARAVIAHVDLSSFQDTLQINGQAYIEDSAIEGDVDFMWGTGPCFFENCGCRSVRSAGYYTQIRNPAANHGYVYHRCTFDGAPGVAGNYLSRIAPGRFPDSEVVLVDCVLTSAVNPAGWLLQGAGDTSRIQFWECGSRDGSGGPADVSGRLPASRQLRLPADAGVAANYSDPAFVLGSGWNPRDANGADRK